MARSIVEIDVADQAFKNFHSLFEKYQAQLKKMPAGWNAVNAGISGADIKTKQLGFDLEDAAGHLKKLDNYQALLNKHAKDGDVSFKGIGKSAKGILTSVKATTGFLLKWAGLGGILGGLMGAGGLLGFGGLAGAAGGIRRTSMGMGVTPGQLQSANAHYGKYMDVNAVLNNISDAQNDKNKSGTLLRLGLSPYEIENKNSAELLPKVIEGMADAFKKLGGNKNVIEGGHFNDIMDYNTQREMAKLSPEERADTAGKYSADIPKMGVDDPSLRAMQEFDEQLEAAKKQIEAAFITGLAPLAPQLTKLSQGVSDAISTFMKTDTLKKWIDEFGNGIKSVADYMATDKFKDDVKTFVEDIAALANVVHSALQMMGLVKDPKTDAPNRLLHPQDRRMYDWNQEDLKKRNHGLVYGKLRTIGSSASDSKLDYHAKATAAALKYGVPVDMFLAQINQESGFNPNTTSKKGAQGIAQLMPATSKEAGINPLDPEASLNFAASMDARLKKKFGSWEKSLSAYNWGEGNLSRLGMNARPDETRNYVKVILQNSTGGSIVASAAAAAAQ